MRLYESIFGLLLVQANGYFYYYECYKKLGFTTTSFAN